MNEAIEKEIVADKTARQAIDQIIQQLKSMVGTRERALAITKLQEGVMWLGKDLQRIAEEHPEALPNPYPHSKDPSNTIIDPTADGLKL